MTYNEAYDKIIQAYFNDEIKPMHASFCFCGTLCDNDESYFLLSEREHRDSHGYLGAHLVLIERALLNTMRFHLGRHELKNINNPRYEDALFLGICAALDILKKIHISKGEVLDNAPVFYKRVLSNQ